MALGASSEFRRLLGASAALGALLFAAGEAAAHNELLLAAGGGGGAGQSRLGAIWLNPTQGDEAAVTTLNGVQGDGAGGAGGAHGLGGGAGHDRYASLNGGGGAGWFGAGGSSLFSAPGGASHPSFNGGAGVGAYYNTGLGGGGFGGGGAGGSFYGGGGVGSYDGGGGGSFVSPHAVYSHGESGLSGGLELYNINGKDVRGFNGLVQIWGPNVLGQYLGYTGGIQTFVTQSSGLYYLTAVGGQGGGTAFSVYGGGYGALMREGINLRAGVTLNILVGGAGSSGGYHRSGGGGGGTFIWIQTPEPQSWLMMEIGVLGVGYALRRRMRRARVG